jgi:hypothetical protein
MKRLLFVCLILALSLLAACSKTSDNETMSHSEHGDEHAEGSGTAHDHGGHAAEAKPDTTKAVWSFAPAKPKAGENAAVTIQIQDASGSPVEKFDVSHEKQMHLIVVSKDLSYFDHIHPEYKEKGQFQVTTKYPSGGDYKLFADYVPTGSAATTKSTWFTVEGAAPALAPITPDAKLTKTVAGKEVTLSYDHLMAGMDVNLTFHIVDEKTKRPITDLQPYLGAVGHVVILSADAELYLHVHPTDEKAKGPDARFMTQFPKSGVYKIWGQFQHNGQTFIVPFVVNVP